jgi:hypothetical protein
MGLSGMSVLIAARARNRYVFVTESHPKVLYQAMSGAPYSYGPASAKEMDALLRTELGLNVRSANDHEWDAAVSALAALRGRTGAWNRDLHALPVNEGERLVKPSGETHYFWPE